MENIDKLQRRVRIGDHLKHDLHFLPSIDEKNGMILAIILGHLKSYIEVLIICDILEEIVDNATSKKFIQTLRSGMDSGSSVYVQ